MHYGLGDFNDETCRLEPFEKNGPVGDQAVYP